MVTVRSAWIPVPLRVGVGTIMTVHGLGKLGIGPTATPGGVAGFSEFLASLGLVGAPILAWVVTLVELVGGLCLLAGLVVRPVAVLVALDMLVATVLVHAPNGFAVSDGGYEFTFLLFLTAVSLVLSGPGILSLDRALFGDKSTLLTTAPRDDGATAD